MAKETLKVVIEKYENGGYFAYVYRELNGQWRQMKMDYYLWKWTAKWGAKRFVQKWAKGKARGQSQESFITVDRQW